MALRRACNHYHPVDHALEPMQMLRADEAAAMARRFVAAQPYFVDAHVMAIAVSRFRRNFWKYRNHAKAYRALIPTSATCLRRISGRNRTGSRRVHHRGDQ